MRAALLLVQGFLAVNALVGGVLLMRAPDGGLLKLPLGFMHSDLFADFFRPGALLFDVLGTGHRAGFLFTLRRYRYASRVAFILGSGTLIWTGVQMLMTDLYWLQGLFAALGLVELVLGRRMGDGRPWTIRCAPRRPIGAAADDGGVVRPRRGL